MKLPIIILSSLIYVLIITPLHGQIETPVTVRVMAHDAKLIGTSMGGVDIVIRDIKTGMIYASGQTSGSTGDTDLLVIKDKSRYGEISTTGSAAFQTKLALTKPVFVEVQATFHAAYTGHPITMSETRWLIPGKEMTGDGIMIDISGFAMRIEHPLPHQSLSLSNKEDVRIDLFMVMLCGCPISPGGTWDSDPMEIEAMIYEGNEFIRSIAFKNVETNHFTADLSALDAGSYDVYVSAYDPRSKNTGVEKVNVTMKE